MNLGPFHWTDIPVGAAYGWSLLLQAWVAWRLGRWERAYRNRV